MRELRIKVSVFLKSFCECISYAMERTRECESGDLMRGGTQGPPAGEVGSSRGLVGRLGVMLKSFPKCFSLALAHAREAETGRLPKGIFRELHERENKLQPYLMSSGLGETYFNGLRGQIDGMAQASLNRAGVQSTVFEEGGDRTGDIQEVGVAPPPEVGQD